MRHIEHSLARASAGKQKIATSTTIIIAIAIVIIMKTALCAVKW